jgi:hypothetical protein
VIEYLPDSGAVWEINAMMRICPPHSGHKSGNLCKPTTGLEEADRKPR